MGPRPPAAECLTAVLKRMISADRVHVTSLSDAPLTIDEWQDRRSILANGRDLTFFRRLISGAAAFMLVVSLSELSARHRAGDRDDASSCASRSAWWSSLPCISSADYRRASAELELQRPDN